MSRRKNTKKSSTSKSSAVIRPQSSGRKILRRVLLILLAVLILFGTGYYLYRTFPKSDGTRTGILFKISRKGYVFKTYEGQIHLGGSQLMNKQSIWEFSAKNRDVYQKMQELEGKMVKCHYKELIHAFPWQGDTNYIVYDAEEIK